MAKIFVVEDDENIRELVLYALNSTGFQGVGFENSAAFFQALEEELPALILLDIMLPDEDGLAILKKLKALVYTRDLPVIMLTAKSSEYDRVLGFNMGVDDYISKPFSILELVARIKAVLRRGQQYTEEPSVLSLSALTLDVDRHVVKFNGEEIFLTYKEFALLHYLMLNQGLVLSRSKLMNEIWGFDYEGESRTVDAHIKTLRQKLGPGGDLIKTIRGVGYKMGE